MSFLAGEKSWLEKMDVGPKEENERLPFTSNGGGFLLQLGFVLSKLPPAPCKVLDAGCGFGWLTHSLEIAGYHADGIDVCDAVVNWAAVQRARWRYSATGTSRFYVQDWDSLQPNQYDAVVFTSALHHCRDLAVTLKSCYESLKPMGRFLACEPGITHGSSCQSKEHARLYNVTERSMPPIRIWSAGKQVGFQRCEVYVNPTSLFKLAYDSKDFKEHIAARIVSKFPLSLAIASLLKWFHGAIVMFK